MGRSWPPGEDRTAASDEAGAAQSLPVSHGSLSPGRWHLGWVDRALLKHIGLGSTSSSRKHPCAAGEHRDGDPRTGAFSRNT